MPIVRDSQTERRWTHAGRVLALLVVWIASGCGSIVVPRVGQQDQYHQNWWNFYRRGLAAMENGDYALAGQHFETCLGLQPGARFGYDAEKWRVRTYGVHMLNAYFPNRELGICRYYLQDDARARELLEKSLRLEPSGRAKHYLNQVNTRLLQGSPAAPPQITLAPEMNIRWTSRRHETVAGVAAGAARIRSITIDGRPEFIELAATRQSFSRQIALTSGTNVVRVVAQDLKQQRTTAHAIWVADWVPPSLIVSRVNPRGSDWLVEARCADENGLVSISVDGVPYAGSGWRSGLASATLEIPIRHGHGALFEARDRAGNVLKSVIQPGPLRQQAALHSTVKLAAATAGLADIPTPLAPAAPDAHADDHQGPRIDSSIGDTPTIVTDDEFFLDGSVSDAAGLATVALDGHELLPAADRGGLQMVFAQRLALAPGTNVFALVARDVEGQTSTRTWCVVHRQPEYLTESIRLSLVVPPVPSDEPAEVADQVKRMVEMALLEDPPRFHVLERGEGWEALLQELRLSVSDLADPRASLRLGRLLSADLLLQAALLRNGAGRTIYARLVDPASGELVLATDVYGEGTHADLTNPVEGLVMKIEQRFPLVRGGVARVKGRRVHLNVGTDQGLSTTARFVVIGHADAGGAVQKHDGHQVELHVRQCAANEAIAEVLPAAAASAIQEGDDVFAR